MASNEKQLSVNPVTGQLEYVYPTNYSYDLITVPTMIREKQMMIVSQEITIESELVVAGKLVITE